jgi:pyruvate formate lyase activating enzyme
MILEYTDLMLFDIKLTDRARHEQYTGVDNQKILDNLANAAHLGIPMIIRFPLIPGVNNDTRTLREVARLAKQAKATEVHILPFHQLGESKWLSLGCIYQCAQIPCPSQGEIEEARRILGEQGLKVNIGGAGGA